MADTVNTYKRGIFCITYIVTVSHQKLQKYAFIEFQLKEYVNTHINQFHTFFYSTLLFL